MCMCHYYSSLLLFAKTERMLSASYLFIFSLFVYLNPSINCPHVDRLTGDDEPPTLRGDPLPSPPTQPPRPSPRKWHALFCLSLPVPLLDQSKRENGVSTVSFPDTLLGRMRFFSACLFRLLNLVSVCEFLPLVRLLSGNTRLHETWRAV